MTERKYLTITELRVDVLDPNPWNPNRMTPEVRAKLRLNLQRDGFVAPIIVRRLGDRFEIVNGEHRRQVAKELGFQTIPCVVLEKLDDRRARILTVNLNELGGDPVPALLAKLLHELEEETPLSDLAAVLPYDEAQIRDTLALLKMPEGLEQWIADEAAKEEAAAPELFSFVVPRELVDTVNRALGHAMERLEGKNRRARGLALLSEEYLKAHEQPAD
jgi:ParB family chromosome partitioning protein